MTKLDGKFYGTIFKAKDDSAVPDDEYVVFIAQDDAFAAILPTYLTKCIELDCDEEQIQAATRLIGRVVAWRKANPDKCKTPDAAGERMLDVS